MWAARSGFMGHWNWQIMCNSSPCSHVAQHVLRVLLFGWHHQCWYHVCLLAAVAWLSAFIWQKSLWFALQLKKNLDSCLCPWNQRLRDFVPLVGCSFRFQITDCLFSLLFFRCVRSQCSLQWMESSSWGSSSCSLASLLWRSKTKR